ncbi:hypothetical protein FHS77_002659 [Paenochrobactrum gallinarii]|uniref:Uncharacterized protein n=1 Tax=Paenochrobactrum gallinarii TaxID=643673 RepID=A0A841M759_9HYPH|nr:hypothetical protein [Paenochrobactrum gallinarii]
MFVLELAPIGILAVAANEYLLRKIQHESPILIAGLDGV